MGAVMPIVSVGLGVASSLGAASSQQKQINSQAKAMEAQNLIAQDQLKLATQELEAQKQTAEFMAHRESLLNQAQVDQANLMQQENEMRQQLAYTQAESQIDTQKSQVRQAVDQILGTSALEQQQVNVQDAAQMEQLAAFLEQTAGIPKEMFAKFMGLTGGDAANVSSQAALAQANQLGGIEQFQRGMENSNAAQRTNAYNEQFSNSAARLQAQFGGLANQLATTTLGYQKQSDALGNQLASSDIYYTGLRNEAGIQAQKYATMGAANMQQANAMYDMQNQNAAYQASLSSLNSQAPGILSYANILGQGFNALNDLGIFGNQPQNYSNQPAGYSFNSSLPTISNPSVNSFTNATSYSIQSQPSNVQSFSIPSWASPSQTFDSNANSYGGFA